MIYSVHLHVVKPTRETFFVDSMRTHGVYHELARQMLPGFIGIDILRNHQDASEFLCLTFYTSLDMYLAAQTSPAQASLARFLGKLATVSVHLGTFSFPAPERLVPKFPGAALTERPEEQSGGNLGFQHDPGDRSGGSRPNTQP